MRKFFISILLLVFLVPIFSFVQAQTTEPDPIIIIPGILGSYSWDVIVRNKPEGEWDFPPKDDTYKTLIDVLEEKGFERDKNLFVAFYDWRRFNEESAQNYLIPIIDKALQNSPSGKVDIIAHSMGGLVARAYIQSNFYRNDVDQLITLGTPHFGSSDAYTLWEGGMVPGNWDKKWLFKFYLWQQTVVTANTADNYDTIHTFIPSIGEMMPTYSFLVDKATGELKPISEMAYQNQFLQNLNSLPKIERLITRLRSIAMIAGTGQGTVNEIPVVARAAEEDKLWTDGMPDPINPERNDFAGDNRVLASSAIMPLEGLIPLPYFFAPPAQNNKAPVPKLFAWIKKLVPQASAQTPFDSIKSETIQSQHGNLPTDAIPQIFEILDLGTPPPVPPIERIKKFLTFWIASPVSVEVIDPAGNKLSKDISQIPGAVFESEDDPLGVKMILIPNPQSGQYLVKLHGLAEGEYHFAVGQFDEENYDTEDPITTLQGSVTPGQDIAYEVTVDADNFSQPAEVEETVVEEQSLVGLIDDLVDSVKAYRQQGQITKVAARVMLLNLKTARFAAQRLEKLEERDDQNRWHRWRKERLRAFIKHRMKAFLRKVDRYQRRRYVDPAVGQDLENQARNILEYLEKG